MHLVETLCGQRDLVALPYVHDCACEMRKASHLCLELEYDLKLVASLGIRWFEDEDGAGGIFVLGKHCDHDLGELQKRVLHEL